MGIKTIGDLAKTSEQLLLTKFGKAGETMYRNAAGLEDSPVVRAEEKEDTTSEEVVGVLEVLSDGYGFLRGSNYQSPGDFFPLCLGWGFQDLLYLNLGPFLARSGITGFRHINNI